MKFQYKYMRFSLLILTLVLFLFPIAAVAKPPVQDQTVWNQTDFWFRDDDGTETSATGYGSTDSVAPGAVFRLRFGIRGTGADGTITPRFEFKQGTDCATGSWTVITPTSDNFLLHLSDNFNDGEATAKLITNGSFVAGKILESTNPASSLDLRKNKNTEYEWSLQAASNIAAETAYSFRITNNGTALNNYEKCPSLTTQPEPEPEPEPISVPNISVSPLIVVFSGQVYPDSKVEVMFKSHVDALYYNIPEIQYTISDDGEFNAAYAGLLEGDYFFGLRAEDKDGRKTGILPFSFELLHVSDRLIAEDLFVPPTVGLQRGTVRKGDFLIVMGYAVPLSIIEVEIDGKPIQEEVEAGTDGFYKASINTAELSFGSHTIQTRQKAKNGKVSDFSLKKTFVVSKLFFPKTDFNNDDKIDISDWSIFLSRWKSEVKEEKKQLDFNEDGKVDISDFSTFLRTIKK